MAHAKLAQNGEHQTGMVDFQVQSSLSLEVIFSADYVYFHTGKPVIANFVFVLRRNLDRLDKKKAKMALKCIKTC